MSSAIDNMLNELTSGKKKKKTSNVKPVNNSSSAIDSVLTDLSTPKPKTSTPSMYKRDSTYKVEDYNFPISTPKVSASSVKEDNSIWDDLKGFLKGEKTVSIKGFADKTEPINSYNAVGKVGQSETANEIDRFVANYVNTAGLNIPKAIATKTNDTKTLESFYNDRDFGEGGGLDFTAQALGYLSPGTLAAKGLRNVGLGANIGKNMNTTQKALQYGKEGALTGLGISLAETPAKHAINPDQNITDHLKRIGLETSIGAIADPALMGLGAGAKKGLQKVIESPNKKQLAQDIAENGVKPKQETLDKIIPTPQKPQQESKMFNDLMEVTKKNHPLEMPNIKNSNNSTDTSDIVKPIQDTFKKTNTVPKEPNERGFINTLKNSEKSTEPFLERLKSAYKPTTNQEVVDLANARVEKDLESAYQFVKNADRVTPEHISTGHRLIDEYQKAGNFERAVDVAEHLAEQGTKSGQSVQAFSIYNRLTPEGVLVHAQRQVNKVNENIGKVGKKVELTNDTAAKLTDLATTVQKMTGQTDDAKDVMSLMEKVKQGKTLTDEELGSVRSFVSDAKKYFGDLSPKKTPSKPKATDKRTRDKVVSFMSKQEEQARERLKSKLKRVNSLPVDVFYDLGVIGASKIAKGTVKVTDFTEEMVKEFGEEVRPYMNQIYEKAVETFNLQSSKMTSKRLSEAEKITNGALKNKTISEEEANVIHQLAKELSNMSGDVRLEASMELQATLQLLERPSFGQKLATGQTIAQLLNPKTTIRNALGNELFYRIERMSKYVATPIDWTRTKVMGGPRTVTFKTNNQGEYWRNWMKGAKAGWRGVNPEGLQTKYDIAPNSFRSKFNPMTYLEKSLGATLQSFDYAGYKRAYNNTLGELATLRAMNEGLKGKELKEAVKRYIEEADGAMMQIADQYGKYATFQDNTTLSNALMKTKRGLNKLTGSKDFGFGDLIIKYPKTPGNLIMRTLEYSPMGLIRAARILHDPWSKDVPFDAPEFAMAFARAIVGTGGFSLLGYVLADKGILTSSGDSDWEVKLLERNAGKQPNSVNVDALKRFVLSGFDLKAAETQEGDTFVSYDWAQPVSMSVALGTGINQSVQEEEKLDPVNATKTALNSAGQTIIDQSVLQGLNDFLTTYPGQTWTDRVGNVGKNIASSFVPTFSNQIRQVTNNEARTTYSPKLLEEIKNRATNRVAGVEKSLPPSYDPLGNQREIFQDGTNSPLNVFFNPSFVSKYNPSPEAKFVLDFIKKTGDKTVAPRYAKKYLMVDGEKVDLTGEQYAEYQRIMGEETMKGLQNVVPRLNNTKDYEKVKKALDKVLRNAGEVARKEMKKRVGEQ